MHTAVPIWGFISPENKFMIEEYKTSSKDSSMANVYITDRGNLRYVEIKGFHRVAFGKAAQESAFEIFFSKELLEKIVKVKKEWFKDEIDRSELLTYLELPLKSYLQRFSINLDDKIILDFGCGSGASSVILGKLGGKKIVGIDTQECSIEIAKLRARDYSLTDKIDFLCLHETRSLPFKNGSFEIVLCNGVIEHMPPEERRIYIKELWRLLTPGGYILVHETPNRLWPIDSHTTGLPLVPYMSPRLAMKFAVMFSKRIRSDASLEELIAKGLRGSTYWEILNPIKHDNPIVLNDSTEKDIDIFFRLQLLRNSAFLKRGAIITLWVFYKVLHQVLFRPIRMPSCAFLPWLTICLQKRKRI